MWPFKKKAKGENVPSKSVSEPSKSTTSPPDKPKPTTKGATSKETAPVAPESQEPAKTLAKPKKTPAKSGGSKGTSSKGSDSKSSSAKKTTKGGK